MEDDVVQEMLPDALRLGAPLFRARRCGRPGDSREQVLLQLIQRNVGGMDLLAENGRDLARLALSKDGQASQKGDRERQRA